MWFWNKPELPEFSENSSENGISYKTILFVVACSGLVYAVAKLVTSVGETAEKIDEVISSDEE